MLERQRGAGDLRQLGFDFVFTPELPLGSLVKPKSDAPLEVIVSAPPVLKSEPLPKPVKVRSVFDEFFNPVPIPVVEAMPVLVQPLVEPPEGWDAERNSFEWSDVDMALVHEGVLKQSMSMFIGKCSDASLIRELNWIYELPEVYKFNTVMRMGRSVKTPVLTSEIPFTFYCACALAGVNADDMLQSIHSHLAASGKLHLLDRI